MAAPGTLVANGQPASLEHLLRILWGGTVARSSRRVRRKPKALCWHSDVVPDIILRCPLPTLFGRGNPRSSLSLSLCDGCIRERLNVR